MLTNFCLAELFKTQSFFIAAPKKEVFLDRSFQIPNRIKSLGSAIAKAAFPSIIFASFVCTQQKLRFEEVPSPFIKIYTFVAIGIADPATLSDRSYLIGHQKSSPEKAFLAP